MKLKLITQHQSAEVLFGLDEGIRKILAAGFDGVDYTFANSQKTEDLLALPDGERRDFMKSLRATVEDAGGFVGQMHAPFSNFNGDPAADRKLVDDLKKAVDVAVVLGCPVIVVHPVIMDEWLYDRCMQERREANLKMFSALIPALKGTGVRAAVENIFRYDRWHNCCPTAASFPEEQGSFVDALNEEAGEDLFTACLDMGHAMLLKRTPAEFIRVLGSRLGAVHVQDLDGIHDLHNAPYTGIIDWQETMDALRENGFSGCLSLEADALIGPFGKALYPQSMALLHAIGRRMLSIGKLDL